MDKGFFFSLFLFFSFHILKIVCIKEGKSGNNKQFFNLNRGVQNECSTYFEGG